MYMERLEYLLNGIKIIIKRGDITDEDVDAIVNPANSLMIMGGGVALAIKMKGGEEIECEARRMAPIPVGSAISTSGGKLKAKYVIHAPTMERPAMRTTEENVRRAVIAALKEAIKLNVKSIAFPAMGAGVGGLSPETSIRIILEEIYKMRDSLTTKEIRLIAWRDSDFKAFCKVARSFIKQHSSLE